MQAPVIAIDGPVASGKSTVAHLLARRLGYFFLDTGLLYRALTLQALRQGVSSTDAQRLAQMAGELRVTVGPPIINDGRQAEVRLDGRDVSHAVRSREVDAAVSAVSAHGAVRDALVDVQRRAPRLPGTVMVGRDIGTVIFPDAALKIYLEASAEERARRRLLQQGGWSESAFLQMLRWIRDRDQVDSSREVAPLRQAQDAIVIDTDDKTPGQIVNQILEIYEARSDSDS